MERVAGFSRTGARFPALFMNYVTLETGLRIARPDGFHVGFSTDFSVVPLYDALSLNLLLGHTFDPAARCRLRLQGEVGLSLNALVDVGFLPGVRTAITFETVGLNRGHGAGVGGYLRARLTIAPPAVVGGGEVGLVVEYGDLRPTERRRGRADDSFDPDYGR